MSETMHLPIRKLLILCFGLLMVGCSAESPIANWVKKGISSSRQQSTQTSLSEPKQWRGYSTSYVVEVCGTYDKTYNEFLSCLVAKMDANPDVGTPPKSELYMRGVLVQWMKSTSIALDRRAQEIKDQGFFGKVFDPIEPYEEWRFIANLREQMVAAESVAHNADDPFFGIDGESLKWAMDQLEQPDLVIRIID